MFKKMKTFQLLQHSLLTILIAGSLTGYAQKPGNPLPKEITVNLNQPLLKLDGFGVNITPAQWDGGNLKSVIDQLVDDLGCTLFRFDNTGLGNWLDAAKRKPDGTWPQSYLDSVYTSKVFTDAWATFRYLNKKGVEPFFNVSGKISPGLGTAKEPQRLADFDGYAEMIVTMLKWAREKEGLKFSLLAPFNETDIGTPEGPKIEGKDMLYATSAVIKKLNENGFGDIKLIAMDDGGIWIDKLKAVLSDSSYADQICAFGVHSYGEGEGDGVEENFKRFIRTLKDSPFKNSSVWLTEYGDLDQTQEMEYEFAWRSTRRLMKFLRYGYTAALAWDAFDNFHEHNQAWCVYGLFHTDTTATHWKYTPKKRYYAAKQIYKYVKPGWKMVDFTRPRKENDVFWYWHDSFRNINTLAFVSPDGKDFTIVSMNGVEADVDLSIKMNGINSGALAKPVHHFITGRKENCSQTKDAVVSGNTIHVLLPEHSISTITTL